MNILRSEVPTAQCFHLVSVDERRQILILGAKYCVALK